MTVGNDGDRLRDLFQSFKIASKLGEVPKSKSVKEGKSACVAE